MAWDGTAGALLAPGRFTRGSTRALALDYVEGLLSALERKNSQTIAGGGADPHALRRLLHTLSWDPDGVRDDLRAAVVTRFGPKAEAWILGETVFAKHGRTSVGVAAQDLADGRRVHGQRAVLLAYSTPRGQALVDRELHLPPSWTDDRERLRAVAVPDTVGAASPGTLALAVVARARAAEGLHGPVVVCGGLARDPAVRAGLLGRGVPAVGEVGPDVDLSPAGAGGGEGVSRTALARGARLLRASDTDAVWGTRTTEWAVLDLDDGDDSLPRGWRRRLIVRRVSGPHQPITTGRFLAACPRHVSASEVVRAASARTAGHSALAEAREHAGLGDYQVRHHPGWYRHLTLAMVAAACREAGRVTPPALRTDRADLTSPWPHLEVTTSVVGADDLLPYLAPTLPAARRSGRNDATL